MRIVRNHFVRAATLVGVTQILLVCVLAFRTPAAAQSTRPIFRSEFRYVILSDEAYYVAGEEDITRDIRVLMDGKAFSEENLTKLFKLLLKRYPAPDWMDVSVMTSLEQVATPEEADQQLYMLSHTNNHPEYDLYNNALLVRQGPNVFYRYAVGLGTGSISWKTVVLKGCDSATSQCADGTQR
jgi:hypothetical protein